MLGSHALLGQELGSQPYTGLANRSLTRDTKAPGTAQLTFLRRRRLCCRALEGQLPKTSKSSSSSSSVSLFGAQQELSGPHKLLEGLPAPARYATSAVIVAGALAAGYALGAKYQGTQTAAVGGAVAFGAVGGATVFALNAAAPHVAAVQLRNTLVNHSDPKSVTPSDVDAIANKYLHTYLPYPFYTPPGTPLSLSLSLIGAILVVFEGS